MSEAGAMATRAPYVPTPGTIPHACIERLKKLPPGKALATVVLAEEVGHSPGTVLQALAIPRKLGAVQARSGEGRGGPLLWSIGDGAPPPAAEDEPDDAPMRQRVVPLAIESTAGTLPSPAWPTAWGGGQLAPFVVEDAEPSAAAAPAPRMRCALWSDGVLIIVRPGQPEVRFEVDETRELVRYLERLAPGEPAA